MSRQNMNRANKKPRSWFMQLLIRRVFSPMIMRYPALLSVYIKLWRVSQALLSWRKKLQRYGIEILPPKKRNPLMVILEMVSELQKTIAFFLSIVVGGILIGLATLILVIAIYWPKLPSLEQLTRYEPILPLQVYTADGELLGEFGHERRTFTPYAEFPKHLIHALVAAEDQRFFVHSGFDPIGLLRASYMALAHGGQGRGTSTITQQLARNFYLNQEKSFERKLVEILLAVKIERELTKEKILEVYMNQIFLGQRAFGFTQAAQVYFGKPVGKITISEAAILAGLPKFPSVNPITKPDRVLERRTYTLKRMADDGYITEQDMNTALAEPLQTQRATAKPITTESGHVAEMARQYVIDLLKTQGVENAETIAYTKGFRVITTLKNEEQKKAIEALRYGLINFELENGFRGPETKLDKALMEEVLANLRGNSKSPADKGKASTLIPALEARFDDLPADRLLKPAVVMAVSGSVVNFYVQDGERFSLDLQKNSGVKRFFDKNARPTEAMGVGSVVRVSLREKPAQKDKKGTVLATTRTYQLTQLPKIEGAMVALNPKTGAVMSLVGGYSFSLNQFNHVTQAWRQPGSTFKPFIYSAAIDHGISAGDVFDDKPLSFDMPDGSVWEPKNYDEVYDGPITVRRALALSKNSVTVQLIEQMGVDYVHAYASRFGFDPKRVPAVLSMGLGSGEVTPMQMVAAYSVFANGGYRIMPHFISEVKDSAGVVYYQYQADITVRPENLVLDPRNVYIMDNILKDVMRYGTGARAGAEIGRPDIAGKTGTTNDSVDTWFCGYQPSLVAVVWVGYDQPQNLGRHATGGKIALPIWIDYMKFALKDKPIENAPNPGNIGTQGEDLILKEFERSTPSDGAEGEIPPTNLAPEDGKPPAAKFF